MINREKPNSQSDFPHTKASVVSFSAPTTILLLPLPFACHQKAKKILYHFFFRNVQECFLGLSYLNKNKYTINTFYFLFSSRNMYIVDKKGYLIVAINYYKTLKKITKL
jgi:hypothetical protein